MKKLLLILSAVFVSVMAYSNAKDPYTLNPYAYDLWSNWDPTTQKLTLRFKVNSVPNLESVEGWGVGIQVLAEDSNGGTYYIWGTPGDVIRAAHNGGAGAYEYTADLSSGVDLNGNLIPRNEDLTWKVRVAGRGNGSSTKYTAEGDKSDTGFDYTRVRYWASLTGGFQNNRLIPQSIAINTNPNSPNFGRVIVADNNNHGSTWYSSWKNSTNRGRGVYAIEPDYLTISNGGKRASLDNSKEYGGFASDQKEPRGICVSDDGRIFVSSYSNNSTVAVWEVTNTNNYASAANISTYGANTLTMSGLTTILEKSKINNYRVVSLDVKGTGNDMKLLLLCCSTTTNKVAACYEYNVSTGVSTPIPLHNDIKNYAYEDDGINIHAKIAYGKNQQDQKIDNVIWIGFSSSAKKEARLYAVDRSGNIKENEKFGDRSAGEGFFIKGNMLIKSYRNYTNSNGNVSDDFSAGILFKKIADDGYTIVMDDHYYDNDSYIWTAELGEGYNNSICAKVVNDIAVDYANNIYLVSIYTGRNFPMSLPYSGRCETTAPAKYKFKLSKAVPNIMAMDLKREPNGNNPSYKFSFVTNAKPTHAEIRFYKKENSAKMFENIKTIHADNYDKGSHTISQPDYVYTFPSTALKQGEMSVILNMVGGERNVQRITNALPPGELYWTVYVEAEKNNAFAPIYHLGGINDGRNHRRHVAVNNYPETDMFGSLIVSDCPVDDVNGAAQGLWIYGFNPSGNCNDATTAVNDASRYSFRNKYLNASVADTLNRLNYPRRVTVAPDGKVYVADEGTSPVGDFAGAIDIVVHERGGLKIWDPNNPNVFSLFADNQINTAFGVALWEHSSGLKVYSSNTYDEYLRHIILDANYTTTQQNGKYGWNGFVEYVVAKYTGPEHTWVKPDSVHYNLGQGDASGNFSLVTMDQGVWICQHREHTVAIKEKMKESPADNKEANLLAFVPYNSNTKTWMSCAVDGVPSNGFTFTNGVRKDDANGSSPWSQTETAHLQSTPGGGLAYRVLKDKSGNIISIGENPKEYEEYLYVVNHDGNIVKIRISKWTNKGTNTATPGLTYITTLTTPGYIKAVNQATKEGFDPQDWKTSFISSMNFDYAGNLVITASQTRAGASHIIVYTMPYNRTNAQEIRASDDRILIPERLAQFDMTRDDIKGIIEDHKEHQTGTCAIDLYRPMQGGMFNTICLPFNLNLNDIPAKHPLNGVEIKQFNGVKLEEIGGENILTLQFGDVNENTMKANTPHIIKPVNNIKGIMELNWGIPLADDTVLTRPNDTFDTDNKITYQGILPKTWVEAVYEQNTNLPLRLILVADNRLAVLTGDGDMYGFRGYFDLAKSLPSGTKINISARKDTPTNTTIVVDGKKVNIEKYLREGRVYIRVGDSLYTIDGQVVE